MQAKENKSGDCKKAREQSRKTSTKLVFSFGQAGGAYDSEDLESSVVERCVSTWPCIYVSLMSAFGPRMLLLLLLLLLQVSRS